MKIKGARVTIEDLRLDHVFQMSRWGKHDNPLLGDYNFPDLSAREVTKWYGMKVNSVFNKYFSIRNEDGELIGYMGIKDIKFIRRNSTLGIVLDPNYINKGYGTEILDTFLLYYFTEMKMRKMILEVAEFNKRAYRVYEKIGFRPVGYYLDEFYNHELDLSNPHYLEHKSSFVIDGKKIYNYIYKMVIEKKGFFSLRSKRETI
ncbi:MAG: GNAT family N-acetyltransferase [Tissierellaceae bacterium]|nr:GNAT family N-acetyltransferase [Tissierellaceae bacterium]